MVESEISAGVVLRGRIDRVDREPDGTLHIIDYKTGNATGVIDWGQIELHALILSKCLPWPVGKISYLYLRTSLMKSSVVTADDLRQVHWRVLSTANKIQQEKKFQPNPSPLCRNCDFISICPGKAEAETLAAAYSQLQLWDDLEDGRG